MRRYAQGFTLIELAVALFIITLILGSLLVPLTTQIEQHQITDTQKTLVEVRDALLGHAIAYGYLPCPDTDNDGNENVTSGICTGAASNIAAGNLPWQTLGVASTDVWGNRFRYVIREEYGRRTPSTSFTLNTTSATVRVCSTAACSPASAVLTSTAVFVVLSYGRNGYGATNPGGAANSCPAGGCSADEQENIDADRDIISRIPTAAGTTAGEFDDIVTWVTVYTLFNRMVAAGKLSYY
jgi:prepilin-type N-terminal cleavage/methylation domain-containing protein